MLENVMGTLVCGKSLVTFSCYARLTLFLPVVEIYKAQILFFSCFHGTLPIAIMEGRCKRLIPFSAVVTHLNYLHINIHIYVCVHIFCPTNLP